MAPDAALNSGRGSERMMRAPTEFVKSTHQLLDIKRARAGGDPQKEKARKSVQRLEAQKLADAFKPRVEAAMENELLEEYSVSQHGGDLYKRFLAKLHLGRGKYLHLYARRTGRGEDWDCKYALWKTMEDPLSENDPDYEDLPDEFHSQAAALALCHELRLSSGRGVSRSAAESRVHELLGAWPCTSASVSRPLRPSIRLGGCPEVLRQSSMMPVAPNHFRCTEC
eukprot:CAMPEP_0117557318 /NCGR_PEP_ID=MMETSP0784-20121206/52265_1 /TAXON_ID=39447 /ORGANISM="" /LENGTH=224 /DNA_ID=CAMNT_0005354625 /DNA_START=78 /DNA_END=750 /DNA_ORIENTATION=+